MSADLERGLARLVLSGCDFTADDLTADGQLALDQGHSPNGPQSGIGSLFQSASRRGLIVFTGRVVRSRAPHRKGGAIRVWAPTAAGTAWARRLLT